MGSNRQGRLQLVTGGQQEQEEEEEEGVYSRADQEEEFIASGTVIGGEDFGIWRCFLSKTCISFFISYLAKSAAFHTSEPERLG